MPEDIRLNLSEIIGSSDDAIISKSLDGIILSWNRGAEKLFGYKAEEALGRPLLILFPPDRAAEEIEILTKIGRGERIDHFETERIAKDGRRVYVSVTIWPIRDAGGTVIGVSKIARDITERIDAERNLRHQASLLARSQHVARLGYIEIEFQNGYDEPWWRTWSAETYSLLGIDPKTAPSRASFMSAVHPDDGPTLDEVYATMGRGGKPADFKFRVRLPDGGERVLECIAQPDFDATTGRIARFFTTLQDVTDRIHAESEHRKQAAMLAKSQQVAHLGCIEVTFPRERTGVALRSWSDETYRLLGLTPGTVTPSREALLAAVHPEDRGILDAAYAEVGNGRKPPDFQVRVITPDGREKILYGTTEVEIETATGRTLHAFSTIQDITEQRQASMRLQAQLARLELLRRTTHAIGERLDLHSILQVVVTSLEDNLPIDFVCCCRFDAQAHVLTVANLGIRSATLARTMALDLDAAIPIDANGLSHCVAGHLVHEPDVTEVPFPFPRRLAAGGLRGLVAVPLVVGGETVFVLIVAQNRAGGFSSTDCEYLRQLGEQLALAVHQSRLYSDLQNAYEEQRRNQEAMLQLERLRVLGQMASGIAHDINNAISPAMLYSEWLLEQEVGLTPDGRRQMATVKRAIEDVANTVARLREFYRRDDGQLEMAAVDLNTKVEQVMDLTRARWSDLPLEHGVVITTRTELQADLPAINASATEVREALINLVFNAVDAMPTGGILTLRTRTHNGRIVVEVVDTGVGMSEDIRKRCMEPFFTTKGERGTGMGLAMVQGIAERHGAEILIESAVGKGTTIRLAFPFPTVRLARMLPAPVMVPPSLRILVIDDDPRLLATLADILVRDGHDVVKAEGGRAGIDAFSAARAAGKPYSLVITDLGMPLIDGRQVAAAIKKASPATSVIMLTGWGQRLVTGGSAPPQVDRILDKPPTLPALRLALSQLFPPSQS